MHYLTLLLNDSSSKEDKVYAAISDITGRQIVSVSDEANKYTFKTFEGSIESISKEIVDDFVSVQFYKRVHVQ